MRERARFLAAVVERGVGAVDAGLALMSMRLQA